MTLNSVFFPFFVRCFISNFVAQKRFLQFHHFLEKKIYKVWGSIDKILELCYILNPSVYLKKAQNGLGKRLKKGSKQQNMTIFKSGYVMQL